MSSAMRGFEPRVLPGKSSLQPPHYTTAPFSFMLQTFYFLTPLDLSGEDHSDLLIAFLLSEQLFSLNKRMFNDFHVFKNKLGRFTN